MGKHIYIFLIQIFFLQVFSNTKLQVTNQIKSAYFQAVLNYEAFGTSEKNMTV